MEVVKPWATNLGDFPDVLPYPPRHMSPMTTTIVIPTLETERLILRAPCVDDFPAWAIFCADEEANQHIGGTMDEDAAWRQLAATIGTWGLRGFGAWSVVEKATGDWVGRVGCVKPHNWPGTEIGWVIARDRWGRGYASESARAAIDFAFETLGWVEVMHSIAPENLASQAVAKRLGSRLEGEVDLPLGLGPTDKWVQTRWDWTARRISGE
jgi:RimJ/RimL family protein N-acetyltransferase